MRVRFSIALLDRAGHQGEAARSTASPVAGGGALEAVFDQSRAAPGRGHDRAPRAFLRYRDRCQERTAAGDLAVPRPACATRCADRGRQRLRPMPERATCCADTSAPRSRFSPRASPALDPDVLTGWNIVDFDLTVLEKIAARLESQAAPRPGAFGTVRIRKAEGYFGSGQAVLLDASCSTASISCAGRSRAAWTTTSPRRRRAGRASSGGQGRRRRRAAIASRRSSITTSCRSRRSS